MHTTIGEVSAVRSAIQAYVDACAAADAEALRTSLHPKWVMYGVDSVGADEATDVTDFVAWVGEQQPPPGYRATIGHVDISGDAAIATLLEESYYDTDYVIYFTLVRYSDRWQITTKTYSQVESRRTT